MSPQLIGGIGVCGLFSLLIIRVPVWAALMLVGFLGNVALIGVRAALAILGTIPFDTASLYGLSVIPLFILTGSIASGTGLSYQRSFSRLREQSFQVSGAACRSRPLALQLALAPSAAPRSLPPPP
jgi:hypothetical protein